MYHVTLQRVPATVAAVEKLQVLHILSVFVFVFFGIQHAMHTHNIVICGLPTSTAFSHVISQTA